MAVLTLPSKYACLVEGEEKEDSYYGPAITPNGSHLPNVKVVPSSVLTDSKSESGSKQSGSNARLIPASLMKPRNMKSAVSLNSSSMNATLKSDTDVSGNVNASSNSADGTIMKSNAQFRQFL